MKYTCDSVAKKHFDSYKKNCCVFPQDTRNDLLEELSKIITRLEEKKINFFTNGGLLLLTNKVYLHVSDFMAV